MTDWRLEAGYTRFPEDNNVIGVPYDAERIQLTQEEVDLQITLTMEMRESDEYKFAKQVGRSGLIGITAKLRNTGAN